MNVLKLLVNPVFLLAAGLHAGLLMIPVAGGSSEDIVPAPDPEGESITVTRIPPQQTQPAASAVGQAAKTNRPATTPVAATQAGGKPTSGSANQQQKSKANPRQQSNQSSGTQSTAASGQTASDDRQSNATAGADDPPGLPDLPADDESNQVPVTVAVQEEAAPQPAPTLIALKDGAESKVPDLLKAFLERLQYSLLKTRDAEAEDAKQAWLSQLAEQSALEIATPEELEKALEISYPITVEDSGPREISSCLTPLPEPGLLGVVVAADGATDPQLLRSTGYAFLNDAALNRIDAYDFPAASSPQAYMVPVAINYDKDACVDLAELNPDASETTAASDR